MISKSIIYDPIEFSVIIPLYNKEKSIYSTIESVLNQTYPNFELIIVNDGSTDQSLEAAKSFNDSRIKIFNKSNGGVSSARNMGIDKSQKQFIIFLDADDLWLPFCLEEFCKLIFEFPDAEIFCTNYNMTGKNLLGSDRRYYVNDYYYALSYFMAKWSISLMITGCVAIIRNLFNEVGYFNQNITHGEDIDMWERLSKKFNIAKSEKITTIYRTETENRASMMDERLKIKADLVEVKRNQALSRSQKLYYGVQFVIELRSFRLSWKDIYILIRRLIMYMDWVIKGLLLIINVRMLNITFDNYIQKAKHINSK
jgi:glycosyltransferase involved in cell wall biosynthesis